MEREIYRGGGGRIVNNRALRTKGVSAGFMAAFGDEGYDCLGPKTV